MTIMLLMPNHGLQPAAELIPNEEIKIYHPYLLKKYKERNTGIPVDDAFQRANKCGPYVRINEVDPKVFALAFEKFAFIHGLQQEGYRWVPKDKIDLPPPFNPAIQSYVDYILSLSKRIKDPTKQTYEEYVNSLPRKGKRALESENSSENNRTTQCHHK